MAYCTQTDLQKQLPPALVIQLTDDDADGAADSGVVADAIAKADNVINAYCAKRYDVPFTTVPDLIRGLSVDLTVWNLYARKGLEKQSVTDRKVDAIKLLEGIASGKVSLGLTENAPVESQAGAPEVTVDVDTDNREITKDTLKNY